jgi:hypothetical protein
MSKTLMKLQAADHVLRLAGRDRPHGFRSSLAERGSRPDLSGEQIAKAVELLGRVAGLPTRIARVVSLACETRHAQPRYTRQEIADLLGVSVRTVHSELASGLRTIEEAERTEWQPRNNRALDTLQAMR